MTQKRGPRWTREEDARLYALKARGLQHKDIGRIMGRPKQGIDCRLYALEHEHVKSRAELHVEPLPNMQPMKRGCLTCRKPFDSQGPHNRLCDHCSRSTHRGLPTQMHAGVRL